MQICFVLEERYLQKKSIAQQVRAQLEQWGHSVEVLLPQQALLACNGPSQLDRYDVVVLKVAQENLGLTIIEIAEALGIPTINTLRSIRLISNKAAAVAYAAQKGIAFPRTYYLGAAEEILHVPQDAYPLVVKPNTGSFKYVEGPSIHLVQNGEEAVELQLPSDQEYVAVSYMENQGFDVKLYVSGERVFATTRSSPLHGAVAHQSVEVTPEMRELALRVGAVFGLDLYGVDVLQTAQGLVPIDVNHFPGYHDVPAAEVSIAEHIVSVAKRRKLPDVVPGDEMMR